MSKIELLLLIVFLLLLILLFKYLQTKRQIRNLSKQIAELVNGKSEKMLDISLIDKDLEQLAGILNQYNDNQRQLIASTLRHENYLKESIANISHGAVIGKSAVNGWHPAADRRGDFCHSPSMALYRPSLGRCVWMPDGSSELSGFQKRRRLKHTAS